LEGGYRGRSDGKEVVVDLGIHGECVWIGLTEAIGRQEVWRAKGLGGRLQRKK